VADTVEDIRQMNFGVDQGLQNYYSKISLGLEKAKVKVLDHSQSIRHEIFGNLGVIVRNSILSDPDMWGSVRSFFGSSTSCGRKSWRRSRRISRRRS